MKAVIGFAVASIAIFTPSSAKRIFYNAGDLDGWDYILKENNGTVQVDKEITYDGDTSIKMTQTYTPGYKGRYHSEVHHNNRGYKRGDEFFYGFSFRLAEDWDFQPQSYNLAQFIANREGAGCGNDDWKPSTLFWLEDDQLASRIVSGPFWQPNCTRDIEEFRNLTAIRAGEWYRVMVHASWQNDTLGFYKMWVDDKPVLNLQNRKTTLDDDSIYQLHVGLYANGWHDDEEMLGNQTYRQVWYNEIVMGTELLDVQIGKADALEYN
ncbi:glucuronan lyase A [Fusarium austroafricanum]|uniref:Glucuronan lyase A n=1 Tax=Fusarium austroafricanum TaxID=2364996 RepID=A0A8H4P2M2_9HYPO|nr:glucuronan lyase A [Fusarium austroafricanum]